MPILLKNGYVIDPANEREGLFDVLIEDDRIRKIGHDLSVQDEGITVINAEGKYVMPGFIDLHVHLREPGYEHKETIKTGAMAAAAGGFTTICPMPNTKPAADNAERIQWVLNKARQETKVNILPIGAVTAGQAGEQLCDIEAMVKAGAIAISEDGKSVMNAALYEKGMRKAAQCGIPVFAHCEDKNLAGKGVINAGKKAEELGLQGISNAVEDIIVARDILLAKESGAVLHICHCSTKDSVKMIALAKKEGLPVTGEVCPHHFTLTEDDIEADNSDYKMNPPLRTAGDVNALREALQDGIIDVIATDHAPHAAEEKAKPVTEAPFGIVGLETAFALTLTELVKKGYLTPRQMVEKMSVNPAKIIGIDRGSLGVGCIADIVIADPGAEYTIDRNHFYSMGKNTPFHGKKVKGRILYTIAGGNIIYSAFPLRQADI